ncbi:hypothetical protein [Holospora curviuscula]|nr:hypothetical protein [Holospora curviuscula]
MLKYVIILFFSGVLVCQDSVHAADEHEYPNNQKNQGQQELENFLEQTSESALAQLNAEQDNNVQNLLVQQRIEYQQYEQDQESINLKLSQLMQKNKEMQEAEQTYKKARQSQKDTLKRMIEEDSEQSKLEIQSMNNGYQEIMKRVIDAQTLKDHVATLEALYAPLPFWAQQEYCKMVQEALQVRDRVNSSILETQQLQRQRNQEMLKGKEIRFTQLNQMQQRHTQFIEEYDKSSQSQQDQLQKELQQLAWQQAELNQRARPEWAQFDTKYNEIELQLRQPLLVEIGVTSRFPDVSHDALQHLHSQLEQKQYFLGRADHQDELQSLNLIHKNSQGHYFLRAIARVRKNCQGRRYLECAALVDRNLKGGQVLEPLKSKDSVSLQVLQSLHQNDPDLVPPNALFDPYIVPRDSRIKFFLVFLEGNHKFSTRVPEPFQNQKTKQWEDLDGIPENEVSRKIEQADQQ